MAKKIIASLILRAIIAIIAPIAMTSAVIGKYGYIGTRNGRASSGSFFLNINTDIMANIYNIIAPKHAMVMISPVLPVYKAIIPIIMFSTKALAGVLNLGFTR